MPPVRRRHRQDEQRQWPARCRSIAHAAAGQGAAAWAMIAVSNHVFRGFFSLHLVNDFRSLDVMLSHRSDHRRNRAMQARHLLSAAALSLAVAACQPAQQEPAKPRPPVILIEADAPPRPMKPELPPLFDDIERRTFQFFWDTTNEINGLTPDRYPSRPFASIASVGFALTAYPIGIENGWVSRNQAIDRTLTTLKFFRDVPMGPQRTGKAGYKGFYYHFLDMQEGRRYDSWVELSSVDTALLMMGVLFAQSYYDGDDPREKEIRQIADTLYRKIDWPWLQQRAPLISMGWFPESGFIDHDWMGYNEAMMVYILALGTPTHPVSPDAWTVWTRTYDNDWGVYQGQEYLSFGPLFGHQYSHVWIDFRDIQDAYMRERGSTYFLNSRSAALAQREYAIANPMQWKDYGENVWGLTASDGPQNTTQEYRGEQRQFRHYSSRGAGLRENFDDGTIAPTAAIAAVVFAPEQLRFPGFVQSQLQLRHSDQDRPPGAGSWLGRQ
ncbi:hypothetical protein G6F57_011512 [Rhizopus arrhizus]|nr:hypothetical protein G6F57_011512 [Rhizopus arrhizus]